MTPNTVFASSLTVEQREEAMSLAKGSYQYGLLAGSFRWSGADLAGKARKWSSKYNKSRQTLVARLVQNGYKVTFGKCENQRIFVTISK